MHGVVDLGGGRREPRDHLAGRELQHGGDLFALVRGHGRRVPVRVLHPLHQDAGACLRLVGGGPGRRGLVQAERLAQPGQGRAAAPDLPGPQDRQHQVDPVGAGRGLPEHVQAVADLGVLDLAQPAVDVQQEVVEAVVVGPVVQAEVVVELGGLDQRPDLGPHGGQLRRVHRGDLGVLVEELLQPGDVAVRLGAGHRRHQVVDEGGVRAALGLRALARVVDQERVDQRQVAERRVRAAGRGQARVLAGQPLQVAVLAEVDHRVRAEPALGGGGRDPAVRGQVVVGRRQVRVVVDRDRVLAEAARGLDDDQQVAVAQRRQHDVALGVAAAVHEHLARRRTPVLLDGRAQFLRQRREPAPVVGGRHPYRIAGQLLLGEPVLVVAAGVDEGADEGVAGVGGGGVGGRGFGVDRVGAGRVGRCGRGGRVLTGRLRTGNGSVRRGVGAGGRVVVQARDRVRPEVVALGAQSAQQDHRAGGRVETDGVADAGVLGRVGGQHQREALVGRRDVPQAGVAQRDPRDPGGAFGIGDVGGQAVPVDLLERERHRDQPPVELGHGDLGRRVQRRDALVARQPGRPRTGQAQRLQDRHVQAGQRAGVPRLVVAARGRLGGAGAARGQHGGEDGVGGRQLGDQAGFGRAQRRHVERQGAAARRLDRVAQGADEGGVPAHVVGAVVEHGHGRAAGRGGLARQRAPRRRGRGRVEAVAGEQHGVRQEAGELLQVAGAAVRQIRVRLGGDADRHGGGRHELGVRGLFTAEDDDGPPVGEQQVEPVLPRPHPAEQADDHEPGPVEQPGQLVQREPGRIGEAVRHRAAGRPRAEQVGVGGGQQQDVGARQRVRFGAEFGPRFGPGCGFCPRYGPGWGYGSGPGGGPYGGNCGRLRGGLRGVLRGRRRGLLPGRVRHAAAGLPRGVRAPGGVGRREFLARPAPVRVVRPWWPSSQWRDRAGFAPGFLPCRRLRRWRTGRSARVT